MFANGSTIASVRAIEKETSAISIKTVIAIAHNINTYGKEQMRQNPKKYKMQKYTNKYLETTLRKIKPYYQKIIQSN